MIKRSLTKIVEDTIQHAPVTLLTGPRQVGKTTLLKHLLNNKSFNFVSLDKQNVLAEAINTPDTFLKKYPYPLIIDEVQKAPILMAEINAIVNESKINKGNLESNGMYILSGSNRKDLMQKSSESLCGRMLMIDMWPLSLSEILNRENKPFKIDYDYVISRSNQNKLSELELFQYIVKGFMPSIYNDSTQNISDYYSTYINSFLEKDLFPIIQIKDHIKFYNFFKLLASNIGQELVYDNYAKVIGVSAVTIRSWVDVLVKTKIIYLLQPYFEMSFTKRIVKRPKLYFFDTGLVCYLLGIDSVETLSKTFLKDRIFECFVINEIIKSYTNNGLPTNNFYYYRDASQHEIDLVYIYKGKLNTVEIKCGSRFNVSDVSASKQLKNSQWGLGQKAIICTGIEPYTLSDGTLVIPAHIL